MRWWRRRHNDAAEQRQQAEARQRRAERDAAHVDRWADHIADLPDAELVNRIARAFGRRP